jgi:hypothetical protein
VLAPSSSPVERGQDVVYLMGSLAAAVGTLPRPKSQAGLLVLLVACAAFGVVGCSAQQYCSAKLAILIA